MIGDEVLRRVVRQRLVHVRVGGDDRARRHEERVAVGGRHAPRPRRRCCRRRRRGSRSPPIWPHASPSFCPSSRATTSVAPPAGNGTIIFTGFVGPRLRRARPPAKAASASDASQAIDALHHRSSSSFGSHRRSIALSARARTRAPRRARSRRPPRRATLCHSRHGRNSSARSRKPPARCAASSMTRIHSASFTSGLLGPAQESVERRLALRAPCPSARKCTGRKSASAMPDTRWTRKAH